MDKKRAGHREKIHKKGRILPTFLVIAAAAVCGFGSAGCGNRAEDGVSAGSAAESVSAGQAVPDAAGVQGTPGTQGIVGAQDAMGTSDAAGAQDAASGQAEQGAQDLQDALTEWGVQAGLNALDEGEEIVTVVSLDRELDTYQPSKKDYNFHFIYNTTDPCWDAVLMGIEDAVARYEEMGVNIEYGCIASNGTSAQEQIRRSTDTASGGFDLIGVDVADADIITLVIDELIEGGQKVMTFSSSDAPMDTGRQRIAYVGDTHAREDGAALTESLCERLGYRGKVAILAGTEGVSYHEDRVLGAQDVIAKYPDMEIVEIEYDDALVEKAQQITKEFLARHDDLAGIVCCNMTDPVGAARAVIQAGRQEEIVIVGMDHDREALQYLQDGVIYALGVQDHYSIGFDTIQVAVKIADGLLPGEAYPEKTEEMTTIIYQDGAAAMLQILYDEIDG